MLRKFGNNAAEVLQQCLPLGIYMLLVPIVIMVKN